uniref:CCHC-type domain-containing protein n=1 Tax=Strongyloides papillosus TaxID=174720 RepID=A0A0N5BCA7_STREA
MLLRSGKVIEPAENTVSDKKEEDSEDVEKKSELVKSEEEIKTIDIDLAASFKIEDFTPKVTKKKEMSSWCKLKLFNPTETSFREYAEMLEQYFLIDEIDEAKKKPILMLKLDTWAKEHVKTFTNTTPNATYAQLKAELIRKYDGTRVRNENRVKAKNHVFRMDDLYHSVLEYIDMIKKGTVLQDEDELDDMIKEKLIEKMSFKQELSQRINDRFEYYDTYEELAVDLDSYWKGNQRLRRQNEKRKDKVVVGTKEVVDKSKVKCYSCNNMGHYSRECPSKPRDNQPPPARVSQRVSNPGSVPANKVCVESSKEIIDNSNDDLVVLPVKIDGRDTLALLDTGCPINLLSYDKFIQICLENDGLIKLNEYKKTLVGAFGQKVQAEGYCEVSIEYENQNINSMVVIVL